VDTSLTEYTDPREVPISLGLSEFHLLLLFPRKLQVPIVNININIIIINTIIIIIITHFRRRDHEPHRLCYGPRHHRRQFVTPRSYP
jgi:hypothetical protein